MPVLGSLQAGMMTDPCREGGGEGARKPGTRGWRHADRRRGSTQDGDTGARRTETQEHAGRRHRSTQDGNAGTRRTETREHAGRRRRGHADANGPQPAKLRQIRKPPYPTSSRNSARCVHYKQKARSQKRPGPVLTCGYSSAATGSSVAAADSHDEQSVHSPAGSAHAAGSTAAGSEAAAGSPAGSSVTAWNSASSVWSS